MKKIFALALLSVACSVSAKSKWEYSPERHWMITAECEAVTDEDYSRRGVASAVWIWNHPTEGLLLQLNARSSDLGFDQKWSQGVEVRALPSRQALQGVMIGYPEDKIRTFVQLDDNALTLVRSSSELVILDHPLVKFWKVGYVGDALAGIEKCKLKASSTGNP